MLINPVPTPRLMKLHLPLPLSLLLVCLFLIPAELRAQEDEQVVERHVMILSAYKDFDAAKADAEKISKASKVLFSMDGRIYDKKKGLIYPNNPDDPEDPFAGEYLARRYDTTYLPDSDKEIPYLSVEKSEGYEGFKPGFYIVVAGIKETRAEALQKIAKFKAWAPTAYVKKTKIYIGCLH